MLLPRSISHRWVPLLGQYGGHPTHPKRSRPDQLWGAL